MTMGLITIAAFLVGIGILVGVHEYGHFWVARRLGFKVLRFSIGFGKPILLRRGRDGIEYALGAIPIGGYVRLADEREAPVAAEDSPRAFNRRPVWQRVLVLVAGAAANFVFAVFAYWILFMHGIPGLRPVVGAVRADSYDHAGRSSPSRTRRGSRTWAVGSSRGASSWSARAGRRGPSAMPGCRSPTSPPSPGFRRCSAGG